VAYAASSMIGRVSLLAVAMVAGCGGGSRAARRRASAEEALERAKYERPECETSGRREVLRDANGDGKNDIRQLMRGNVETCREVDGNFDGRMDFYRFFSDSGVLERLDEDLDFDGHVDQITIYRGGQVARRDIDTNFDDMMDTHEVYTAGVLMRAERDANMDGSIDYWETYQGGRLARVQWDEDGDGRPDRTDDHPEDEAGGAPAAQGPPPPQAPPAAQPPPAADAPAQGAS
jgi:hypothetical protein